MRRRRAFIPGLLVVAAMWGGAPGGAAQEPLKARYVKPEIIQQRLEDVPKKQDDRRTELESLFREVGCDGDHLTELPVSRYGDPDVVCVLPGEGPGKILAGGHFDRVNIGRGAVDDWSGVSLLPSLYQGLKGMRLRHTFVFIGFASEETGLQGSRSYVGKLSPEDRSAIRAMVNLECLGMTSPKVWASRADKTLLNAYGRVAEGLGLRVEGVNVDKVGDDDTHPFLDAHIPVITIHSVTSRNIRVLHSSGDNLKAIDPVDYYNSYKLAATYLTYLDTALP